MSEEARGEGKPDDEEKRRLEEEIEEILRRKGEPPARARRPWPHRPRTPPLPPVLANGVRYLLLVAAAAVLVFLSLRVLGPAGLRLVVVAALLFLFFFTVRGVLGDILRRRRRR